MYVMWWCMVQGGRLFQMRNKPYVEAIIQAKQESNALVSPEIEKGAGKRVKELDSIADGIKFGGEPKVTVV